MPYGALCLVGIRPELVEKARQVNLIYQYWVHTETIDRLANRRLARDRARVVIVGDVGMQIPRTLFYQKELSFQVSCSYGPGRYDPSYEEKGNDYPIGYVRWTEGRNMESILDLMAAKKLNVERMITHRIPITEAGHAYDMITGRVKEPYLGIILQYPDRGDDALVRSVAVRNGHAPAATSTLGIGFIGAGNFAQSYLIPPAKNAGARLVSVATSTSCAMRSRRWPKRTRWTGGCTMRDGAHVCWCW